jgi:hypothetical protein
MTSALYRGPFPDAPAVKRETEEDLIRLRA